MYNIHYFQLISLHFLKQSFTSVNIVVIVGIIKPEICNIVEEHPRWLWKTDSLTPKQPLIMIMSNVFIVPELKEIPLSLVHPSLSWMQSHLEWK